MKKILFICLGNICRSPMAETIINKMLGESQLSKHFIIDSAGLESYHEGDKADSRMRAHAYRRGYNITHISRPMNRKDWDKWDYIICMDMQNRRALENRAPSVEYRNKIKLITNYCDKFCLADCVPDPYYGGEEGFEYVIDILEDACEGIIKYFTQSSEQE